MSFFNYKTLKIICYKYFFMGQDIHECCICSSAILPGLVKLTKGDFFGTNKNVLENMWYFDAKYSSFGVNMNWPEGSDLDVLKNPCCALKKREPFCPWVTLISPDRVNRKTLLMQKKHISLTSKCTYKEISFKETGSSNTKGHISCFPFG